MMALSKTASKSDEGEMTWYDSSLGDIDKVGMHVWHVVASRPDRDAV